MTPPCTCGSTGARMGHEDFCGQPDTDPCDPGCVFGAGHDDDCMTAEDVREEKLRARDYEAWSRT